MTTPKKSKQVPAPAATDGKADAEAAAIWVPIASLKAWDKNPRDNDAAVEQVAESIKRFGFGAPILARKADGEIIAGHTRWKASKLLGLEKVPVRFLNLDPADAHLLALADNKLGEIAEWNEEELAAVLAELKLDGADLELSGFDPDELDRLLDPDGAAGGGEDPGPTEPPANPVSKRGEIYELGSCLKCPCCGDLIEL